MQGVKRKAPRNVCAVKTCVHDSGEHISLFRFPKASERCRQWAQACDCIEMFNAHGPEHMYNSKYRVCGNHFQQTHFLNDLKNRLHAHAIPTLLLQSAHCSSNPPQISNTESVVTPPVGAQQLPVETQTKRVHTSLMHSPTTSTQTSSTLSANVLRTTKTRTKIRILGRNQKNLSKKLQSKGQDEKHFSNVLNNCLQSHAIPTLLLESALCSNNPPESSNTEAVVIPPVGVQKLTVQTQTEGVHTKSKSTQTSVKLSSNTPKLTKLRAKIRSLQHKQNHLSKKLQSKSESVNTSLDSITLSQFKQLCDKFLLANTANMVKLQLDLDNKKLKGRRYSNELKNFALSLYFTGPQAYKYMSTVFRLPNPRTLSRITENLKLQPGINQMSFETIKTKAACFNDVDKQCMICVDEMAIKAHLFYNTSEDKVIGFENIGRGSLFKPALNVLVVMIKGLNNKWKQLLSYHFVHSTIEVSDLLWILEESIKNCTAVGLNIVSLVSDMSSNFINLANMMNVTPETPFFFCEGKKIMYMFDVPRLIKATRNNLEKHKFYFENKFTNWAFVEEFYNHQKTLLNRPAPKLTDAHIHPIGTEKIKVKLAIEVLSATVAAGLSTYISLNKLSADAVPTVEIIERMDKLFDLFNSSKQMNVKKFNLPFKGESFQLSFLDDCLIFFKNVEIFTLQGKNITKSIKFNRCWQISINCLKELWPILQTCGFKYFLTRRLNQDDLQKFFCSVRQQGGQCINPTSIQFTRAFKKLFSVNTTVIRNPRHTKINVKDCWYKCDVMKQNIIRYISGYLISKCHQKHTCSVCESYSNEYKSLDITTFYTCFKAYEDVFEGLHMPNDNFFYYILTLERCFNNKFESFCTQSNVAELFKNELKNVSFSHPCSEFPAEYLINLYCRMKLCYTLKFINRNFKILTPNGEKIRRKEIVWHT